MTHGPCCSTYKADGNSPWKEVVAKVTGMDGRIEAPPQMIEGMTSLIDIGKTGAPEIGRIFTYVNPVTATWTEHWVLQAGQTWFTDPTRQSRLSYAKPQPAPQPWPAVAPTYGGWLHAAVTFQYTTPPGSTPLLPIGTFAFDVRCNGVTPAWQGRLFRTTTTASIRDRWILFPGYVRPAGSTTTELRPVSGLIQQLFADALAAGGPTSEYVDTTYTVAPL